MHYYIFFTVWAHAFEWVWNVSFLHVTQLNILPIKKKVGGLCGQGITQWSAYWAKWRHEFDHQTLFLKTKQTNNSNNQNDGGERWEMTRAPVSSAENRGSILSTHMVAQGCTSSSRRSDALLWSPHIPSMQMVPRQACRWNSDTHK